MRCQLNKCVAFFVTFVVMLAPQFAFAENPRSVLESYLKKASVLYKDSPKSIVATRGKLRSYWSLAPGDARLPDLESGKFFALYQPAGYKMESFKTAGDFARGSVTIEVGNKLQLKLGESNRRVRYDLIRVGEEWKLANFVDLTAKEKLSKAQKEQTERKEFSKAPDSASAKELLSSYLDKLLAINQSADATSAKNFLASVGSQTQYGKFLIKEYWSKKASKREAAQSLSAFALRKPIAWEFVSFKETHDTASAVVSATATTKIGVLGESLLVFELLRVGGQWKITGFNYKSGSKQK